MSGLDALRARPLCAVLPSSASVSFYLSLEGFAWWRAQGHLHGDWDEAQACSFLGGLCAAQEELQGLGGFAAGRALCACGRCARACPRPLPRAPTPTSPRYGFLCLHHAPLAPRLSREGRLGHVHLCGGGVERAHAMHACQSVRGCCPSEFYAGGRSESGFPYRGRVHHQPGHVHAGYTNWRSCLGRLHLSLLAASGTVATCGDAAAAAAAQALMSRAPGALLCSHKHPDVAVWKQPVGAACAFEAMSACFAPLFWWQ